MFHNVIIAVAYIMTGQGGAVSFVNGSWRTKLTGMQGLSNIVLVTSGVQYIKPAIKET
jgi:hypothetical protein